MWEDHVCLSWDEMMENFTILDIPSVPILWRGIYDETTIRALYNIKRDYDTMEGYVIRLADSFTYGEFKKSVSKYVRPNHVTSAAHWRHKRLIKNTWVDN